MMTMVLNYFQGIAGDHNQLAIPGAASLAEELSKLYTVPAHSVGRPSQLCAGNALAQLSVCRAELQLMQDQLNDVYQAGNVSLAATSRCAVSLATLPIIARYHPKCCVVWLDAHADLNTPENSQSGYLGGMALSGPLGLWDTGLGCGLSREAIILAGQRAIDSAEQQFIEKENITCIPIAPDFFNRVHQAIAGRSVYFHLDCDVLAPGIVPTDYVHAGGLQLSELYTFCRMLAKNDIIGIEIAEYQISAPCQGEVTSPIPLLHSLEPVIKKLQTGKK